MRLTRAFLLGIGLAALGLAADLPKPSASPAKDQTRSVVMGEADIQTINAQVWVPTLIILPEGEKVVGMFCGQCITSENATTGFWQANLTADRFISIKPALVGAKTDLHILTDHGHTYTFRLVEVSKDKDAIVDVKLFVRPTDADSLNKPPVLVTAAEADKLKAQAADAEAKLAQAQADARQQVEEQSRAIRTQYPAKLQFDYTWNRGKNPFGVSEIYRDDKFTYLKLNTQELPSLYEMKDGKKSLIQYQCDRGMCTVPKIVDEGYLTIGKKTMGFRRELGG
jgi:type IV secretion system protein VirB9